MLSINCVLPKLFFYCYIFTLFVTSKTSNNQDIEILFVLTVTKWR